MIFYMKKFHKQVCIFLSASGIERLKTVPGKRMATLVRVAIEEKYALIKDQPTRPMILPVNKGEKDRRVFLLSDAHVDMAWAIVRHHSLFSLSEAIRLSLKEYFIRYDNEI